MVGSSMISGVPSAFLSFDPATSTGLKSATAAAIRTMSAVAELLRTAVAISAAVSTASTWTPMMSGAVSGWVVTHLTLAPRAAAARARAWPCFPDDRLPT